MRRTVIAASFLLAGPWAFAQQPVIACGAAASSDTVPIAPELAADASAGVGSGVLGQAYDDALSLDEVLLRQSGACQAVASVAPPASPGSLAPTAAPAPAPVPAPAQGVPNTPGGAPPGVLPASTATAPPAGGDVIDPATYKPRTEFDNTPWRFNMSQNGERMTADAFSEWMKARGVRVARGAATAVAGDTQGVPADATATTTIVASPATGTNAAATAAGTAVGAPVPQASTTVATGIPTTVATGQPAAQPQDAKPEETSKEEAPPQPR